MIAKLAKHFSPCPTACVILVLCACLALAPAPALAQNTSACDLPALAATFADMLTSAETWADWTAVGGAIQWAALICNGAQWTGSAPLVIGPLHLEAGTYNVTYVVYATARNAQFEFHAYTVGGDLMPGNVFLNSATPLQDGSWAGAFLLRIREDGDVLFEVGSRAAQWQFTVARIGGGQ